MRVKCAECGAHVPHEVVVAVALEGDEVYFCSAACVSDAELEGRLPAVEAGPLPPAPRAILVASDGSGPARRAVEYAAALARATGGRVEILHAIGGRLRAIGLGARHTELMATLAEHAEQHLARDRRICDAAGVPCTTRVSTELPLEAVLAAAAKADLVVIGSSGAGAAVGGGLGGLSQNVLNASTTPVLVVH
jgi:nucleotide-binding universal stress UspA family protein